MENASEDSQRRVLVAVDGSSPSELAMKCEFSRLKAHIENLGLTYVAMGTKLLGA